MSWLLLLLLACVPPKGVHNFGGWRPAEFCRKNGNRVVVQTRRPVTSEELDRALGERGRVASCQPQVGCDPPTIHLVELEGRYACLAFGLDGVPEGLEAVDAYVFERVSPWEPCSCVYPGWTTDYRGKHDPRRQ